MLKNFLGVLITLHLVSASFLSYVNAEVVYDSPKDLANPTEPKTISEDQSNGSQLTNEKSGVENKADLQQQQKSVVIPTAALPTVATPTAVENESSHATRSESKFSQSESIRRERLRKEVENEDLLHQRIEELRLKDEQKRTEKILKNTDETSLTEEKIATPVTEKTIDQVVITQASAMPVQTTSDKKEEDSSYTISIMPRGGISNMSNHGGYNLESRYTVGAGIEVGASEHVAFEAGYQFSEYGLKYAPNHPYLMWYQSYDPYGYQAYSQRRDTHVLKQNVFDLGVKVHLLGRSSKVRPFLGGGGGYSRSYINYDRNALDFYRRNGYHYLTSDYELSSFLGYLSGGIDFQLSKSISVGAVFKYYNVLSSRENAPIHNGALTYGPYGQPYALMNYPGAEKEMIGGSLSKSNFYTILGGISFQF